MSPPTAVQAAARWAFRLGLAQAQHDRLLILLAGDQGLELPADTVLRKRDQVQLTLLRAALDKLSLPGLGRVIVHRIPLIPAGSSHAVNATLWGYKLDPLTRQALLDGAAALPDPDQRLQPIAGAQLTASEAALHHLLVAAGDAFSNSDAILAALAAAGCSKPGATFMLTRVHISRLRVKIAATRKLGGQGCPLHIETRYGKRDGGYRYTPESLAAFLADGRAAPAPHLSPLKKDPAR